MSLRASSNGQARASCAVEVNWASSGWAMDLVLASPVRVPALQGWRRGPYWPGRVPSIARTAERRLDRLGQLGRQRLDVGAVARDRLAVAADEVLVEIPARGIASAQGLAGPNIEGMRQRAVDRLLGREWEGDAEGALAEAEDLGFRLGLLLAEV